MSRIEELVERLCPDGVKFESVDMLAEVGTGNSDRKDAVEGGPYPFYVRSQKPIAIDTYQFDDVSIIIPGEGGIGDIFHITHGKYALHQRAYRIHFTSADIDTQFAYYYFSSHFKSFIMSRAVSATVTSIRKPMILKFQIPLPPLVVQHEIVKILDTFTDLESELESELEARRLQFRFYQEKILLPCDDTPWTTLSDIADIGTGNRNTNEASSTGTYPFFVRSQEPLLSNSYQFDETAIITAGDGVGVGRVFHFVRGKYALHQRAYRISPQSELVEPKFLFYWIRFDFPRYLTTTSVHASVTSLRRPMWLFAIRGVAGG